MPRAGPRGVEGGYWSRLLTVYWLAGCAACGLAAGIGLVMPWVVSAVGLVCALYSSTKLDVIV